MVQKKCRHRKISVTFSIKDRDKFETDLNKPLPTLLENINISTKIVSNPHPVLDRWGGE